MQRWNLRGALAGAAMLSVTLVACGGTEAAAGWDAQSLSERNSAADLTVMHVNSSLGKGENRLALALIDEEGRLVSDATVAMNLYRLEDDGDGEPRTGTEAGEYEMRAVSLEQSTNHIHEDGSSHEHLDPLATVYVAHVEFDREGFWGAELDIERESEQHEGLRVRFYVRERTNEPGLGEPAPASEQTVLSDVESIEQIDSSDPPRPELHDMTIAEGLASGKPLVVAFATPAFCQTRFCGPVVDVVVAPLHEQYGDRVHVMHIEPFDLAEARQGRLVPTEVFEEWNLISEPFVFVVDAEGKIAGKFEGIMEREEITEVLDRLLAESAAVPQHAPVDTALAAIAGS